MGNRKAELWAGGVSPMGRVAQWGRGEHVGNGSWDGGQCGNKSGKSVGLMDVCESGKLSPDTVRTCVL